MREWLPPALGLDRYGGLLEGPNFDATGFFRTERRDGRWWLVTSDGHGFFSLGVDVVRPDVGATFVEGREFMFAGLPEPGDPLAAHYGYADERSGQPARRNWPSSLSSPRNIATPNISPRRGALPPIRGMSCAKPTSLPGQPLPGAQARSGRGMRKILRRREFQRLSRGSCRRRMGALSRTGEARTDRRVSVRPTDTGLFLWDSGSPLRYGRKDDFLGRKAISRTQRFTRPPATTANRRSMPPCHRPRDFGTRQTALAGRVCGRRVRRRCGSPARSRHRSNRRAHLFRLG